MTIDDKLEIKNTKLTERQQKYQHYHQEHFINMNILLVKKYYQNFSLLGKEFRT